MERTRQKTAVIFVRTRCHGGDSGAHDPSEVRLVNLQRDICTRIAERLGVAVAREYVEYGGAGKITHRPVLRQMLDELRAIGEIDYLITVSTDQLARFHDDWLAIELELAAAHIELVTVLTPIKGRTAAEYINLHDLEDQERKEFRS